MRYAWLLIAMVSAGASAQWTMQESHTTASLRGIHSVDGKVAWASGTSGTVLRTVDGGKQWQVCAVPEGAETLDFRGVQAFDALTAIVMASGKGDLSRLYKTVDGCATWRLVFTNPDKDGFWDAVKFTDRNVGVILGDPVGGVFTILLTFDGGGQWEQQTLRATADINGESAFAASNSAMSATRYGRVFGTGGRAGPRIISLGAGPTDEYAGDVSKTKKLPWESSLHAERLETSQSCDSCGVFSISESDDGFGTVVAVGGDYAHPNERRDTAWTNAFESASDPKKMLGFKRSHTSPRGYRSAVAFTRKARTWITVGPTGTEVSYDDGRNWRALTPGPQDMVDADKNWNALSLPFVVGPKGRIGVLQEGVLTTVPK